MHVVCVCLRVSFVKGPLNWAMRHKHLSAGSAAREADGVL